MIIQIYTHHHNIVGISRDDPDYHRVLEDPDHLLAFLPQAGHDTPSQGSVYQTDCSSLYYASINI